MHAIDTSSARHVSMLTRGRGLHPRRASHVTPGSLKVVGGVAAMRAHPSGRHGCARTPVQNPSDTLRWRGSSAAHPFVRRLPSTMPETRGRMELASWTSRCWGRAVEG